ILSLSSNYPLIHSHPLNFPPSIPSSTLLLFKYPPSLHSHSSSHIIHSFPYTHPSLIHKLLTVYPQLFHRLSTTPYLINRPFIFPFIPTYIAISPIIPIVIPTQTPSIVIHRYTKLSTSYPQSNILIHRYIQPILRLNPLLYSPNYPILPIFP